MKRYLNTDRTVYLSNSRLMTRWEVGEYGAPILPSSLGIFECKRHTLHEAGDHFILVGRVEKASFEPRRDPLLYFRGKYRRLHFT